MGLLLQYKWYRDLFNKETYLLVEDMYDKKRWVNQKEYKGGKVLNVDGAWNTQAFCSCGNELVHSKSYIGERIVHTERQGVTCSQTVVWDYQCSYCAEPQHWSPDVIPGLLQTDKWGNPL